MNPGVSATLKLLILWFIVAAAIPTLDRRVQWDQLIDAGCRRCFVVVTSAPGLPRQLLLPAEARQD
jgi:hypothetical protein